MEKYVILLPRDRLEFALMLAKHTKIHVCIKLTGIELPIGRFGYGFVIISERPCKDPTMYDIEVTSTTTIEDIIRKLREEIYELTGEWEEIKLFDREICVLDKETKRPTDIMRARKPINITFYIVDNEPLFAEVYDYELHMRYEITNKTKLRELLERCKVPYKK